jgi:hypothetical protein
MGLFFVDLPTGRSDFASYDAMLAALILLTSCTTF